MFGFREDVTIIPLSMNACQNMDSFNGTNISKKIKTSNVSSETNDNESIIFEQGLFGTKKENKNYKSIKKM